MADRRDDSALRLPGLAVDPERWRVHLRYELTGAAEPLRFTETVTFPAPARAPDAATRDTFDRVLQLLYLAAGTSYYKVSAPPRVRLDGARIGAGALPWATALYRDGLAEFAYRNDLPHVLGLDLEPRPTPAAPARRDTSDRPPLVSVGGGKDSIVSAEAMRAGGFDPVLFAVNPNEIITSVMAVSGLPALTARRQLDRSLFDLNRAGAYNGHVPVTAINTLVAVATAVLHGLGPVVMSNESSASIPNLVWHDRQINHQWSKGLAAERLLAAALERQAGLVAASFSLLRPWSELRIARVFAGLTGYDAVMTSCNVAFRLSGRSDRWCGECPKCQFVFLALAPFLSRTRLVGIFGADLLADERQLPGYRELTGITAHKPFECVGDVQESLVAFRLLAGQPEWADAPVVRRIRAEVPAPRWPTAADVAAVLADDPAAAVPAAYRRALDRLEAAQHAAG